MRSLSSVVFIECKCVLQILKMRDFMTSNSVFYLQKETYDDIKEYVDDFKQVIRERETTRIPFLHQSPQIDLRKNLVEYAKKVCCEKSFSQSCLHLCVYLLDIFMDNHHIIPERLMLVTNVCLSLAAKLEENAFNVPKISELNALVDNNYTITDYRNLEILILKFFHFCVKYPTPAHYVYYYMQGFITLEDLKDERNFRTLVYDIHEFITIYLDKILEDVHYMQDYKPSILAAAVIAASRKDAGLSCWTKQLEELTDYTLQEIEQPMQSLLEKRTLHCPSCAFRPLNNNLEKN